MFCNRRVDNDLIVIIQTIHVLQFQNGDLISYKHFYKRLYIYYLRLDTVYLEIYFTI